MIATKTIPLMTPYVPPRAIEYVSRTLLTRWIGQGPQVDEFEREFSRQIVGGRSCVAVSSCTAALHLAYLLSDFKPQDEIIAPLFTCTATNEAILHCDSAVRPKIRFCDVAPDSLNMSPAHAMSLINEHTKALATVHYGGAPVDPRLFQLGLPVIEDCAQAVGPGWPGIRGEFACFSFQAVKHITTADGGMLVLPDHLVDKAKRLRWFGIDRVAKLNGIWANDITEVGFKYQMTDVAAAMGLAGLQSLDEQLNYRRALRETYIAGLRKVDGIRMLDVDPDSACWLCTVLVDRREDFRRKLIAEGIESDQVHYRNDRYSIFKEFPGEFPNMDAIDSRYLVLPLHMGMNVDDVARICEVIRGGW